MSGPQGVILPGVGGTLNACAGLGAAHDGGRLLP